MDAATWVQTVGSVVVALSALVTGIVAVATLRQTAADSRDRSRPMVVASFEGAELNPNAIDLVVANRGRTVATQVNVAFSPALPVPAEGDFLTECLSERYATTLPTLVPDHQLRNLWWSGKPVRHGDLENSLATPDEVVVSVRYRGPDGSDYRDEFPLTVRSVSLTTYSVSSESVPGRLTSIARSLEKIAARSSR